MWLPCACHRLWTLATLRGPPPIREGLAWTWRIWWINYCHSSILVCQKKLLVCQAKWLLAGKPAKTCKAVLLVWIIQIIFKFILLYLLYCTCWGKRLTYVHLEWALLPVEGEVLEVQVASNSSWISPQEPHLPVHAQHVAQGSPGMTLYVVVFLVDGGTSFSFGKASLWQREQKPSCRLPWSRNMCKEFPKYRMYVTNDFAKTYCLNESLVSMSNRSSRYSVGT